MYFKYSHNYYYIYLNLESSYLQLGKNLLCADLGYIDIDEEKHCNTAAEEKGLVLKIRTESSYPKGCYLNKEKLWFNYHSVGSREKNSVPICKGIFHPSRITA